MDSRYVMNRVLRGYLVEGVRKKDFMQTYELLKVALSKMYDETDNIALRGVISMNNLLRLCCDFEFFSGYGMTDEQIMDRLNVLYDWFNKSKYGSWLLARMRDVARAYVSNIDEYESLSTKNMDMLRLGTLARSAYPSRAMYQARDIFFYGYV